MKKIFAALFLLFIVFFLKSNIKAAEKNETVNRGGHHQSGGHAVGNDMVLIPGGEFIMGSTSSEVDEITKTFSAKKTFNKVACMLEAPQRKVSVKPFYIDRYEVTNLEYQKFVIATGHQPPPNWTGKDYPLEQRDYPVVMITYKDAEAYAKWAGKRLPTEAEWEKAARGADGRRYPWGNTFESGIAHTAEAVHLFGGSVGMFPKDESPYGVHGMAGNVSEWTSDWYDSANKQRVVKGGAWAQLSHQARCAARDGVAENGMSHLIGFRCVMDAEK